MTADMLAHLFEPFTQADATLARSRGGLGLGLALAQGLVEQHGGTITAASPGIDLGCTFTVRLPVVDAGADRVTGTATTADGPQRRVLIIDDNVDAADSLRQVLALQGHTVGVAYNGVDGIAKARELLPDVVLCDIGLPLMDGYEIARRLRADGRLHARLIALSGYALPADVERAHAAGFDRHVAKPIRLDQLVELLSGSENPK
jgi:CheY-like chemotaxis protein